jgi:subtilisin family serine protease
VSLNTGATVVVAAGNEGDNAGQITSPALGYYVLSVGSFDDHNTGSWLGDDMAARSSDVGPTSLHGARTKPEIAAPGHTNETFDGDALASVSGTSVAAPRRSTAARCRS